MDQRNNKIRKDLMGTLSNGCNQGGITCIPFLFYIELCSAGTGRYPKDFAEVPLNYFTIVNAIIF